MLESLLAVEIFKNSYLYLLVWFTGGLLVGWFWTYLSIRLARYYNVKDMPGRRSSHDIPTPRLGGIGIAVPMIMYYLFLGIFLLPLFTDPGDILRSYVYALISGGLIMFLTGLWDDFKGLSPLAKLLAQSICAIIPLVSITGDFLVTIPGFDSPFISYFVAFAWILFVINAFNFMDGMNGMLGVFTIVVSLFAALFIRGADIGIIQTGLWLIAGTTAGFLVFNLSPAVTFMGDCGSQFIGYFVALTLLAIHGSSPSEYPAAAFLILLLPFIYDVVYTLLRRLLHGENILKAHRSHLYQRLLIAGWSHRKTLRLNFIIFLLCGMLAWIFTNTEKKTMQIMIAALSLLLMLGYTVFVIKTEKQR